MKEYIANFCIDYDSGYDFGTSIEGVFLGIFTGNNKEEARLKALKALSIIKNRTLDDVYHTIYTDDLEIIEIDSIERNKSFNYF